MAPEQSEVHSVLNRYRVTDELWLKLRPIIELNDPPVRTSGRKRIDARAALDAIIYQMLTGCGWNKLPSVFPDDSSVHRTYQRWKRQGILNTLWATIVEADLARQSRAG
jgi:transposase